MFVISLRYIKPIAEVDRVRPAHMIFLKKYYAAGNFVLSGRKSPVTGGIIIAQAVSIDEIQQIIQEDPFYTEQIAEFEIIEFSPNLAKEGLEQLVET